MKKEERARTAKPYNALNKKLFYWGFTSSEIIRHIVIALLVTIISWALAHVIFGILAGLADLVVSSLVFFGLYIKKYKEVSGMYKKGHPSYIISKKVWENSPVYLLDFTNCIETLRKSNGESN